MHVTCEYIKLKQTVINLDVQTEIHNTEDAIMQIDKMMREAEDLIEEYQEEVEFIKDVSSKFAFILSTNSYFVSIL